MGLYMVCHCILTAEVKFYVAELCTSCWQCLLNTTKRRCRWALNQHTLVLNRPLSCIPVYKRQHRGFSETVREKMYTEM